MAVSIPHHYRIIVNSHQFEQGHGKAILPCVDVARYSGQPTCKHMHLKCIWQLYKPSYLTSLSGKLTTA